MANLVLPNEAKLHWLQAQYADMPTLTDCYLKLFTTLIPVDQYTTRAELEAVQATFPGYLPMQLEGWSSAVLIDGQAMTEADPVSFSATVDTVGIIYGCYATNAATNKFWGVCLFQNPVPIPFTAELQVTVTVNLASIFN